MRALPAPGPRLSQVPFLAPGLPKHGHWQASPGHALSPARKSQPPNTRRGDGLDRERLPPSEQPAAYVRPEKPPSRPPKRVPLCPASQSHPMREDDNPNQIWLVAAPLPPHVRTGSGTGTALTEGHPSLTPHLWFAPKPLPWCLFPLALSCWAALSPNLGPVPPAVRSLTPSPTAAAASPPHECYALACDLRNRLPGEKRLPKNQTGTRTLICGERGSRR